MEKEKREREAVSIDLLAVSHALAPDRRVFSPPPFQWPISNNIPRKERKKKKESVNMHPRRDERRYQT